MTVTIWDNLGEFFDGLARDFHSLSILVFQPNPWMHRPEAQRWTRGFTLKSLRFP